MEELNGQKDIDGKNVSWYGVYGGKSSYNPEFSNSMNDEFIMVFEDITEQFWHSQRAAMASDLSYELVKIKWLVNQVDAAMSSAEKLEKHLQDIKDYQCSM